ncbi:nitrous oxide reductase family maturation protein NosD [Ammoniphilus resinae]|uniref:Nitrous oxidase accessory protein n=1 Tax=Ammoniphilus resinae TaxID=861532 RepID=A0ABS4GQC9_9BACL|nr:nitrous oxide reductase family maturation protein NosD [Ammoniphilus resinae]MBP1932454.1 nitrous oxidase accessory protein [Ammoniphilus resinae]
MKKLILLIGWLLVCILWSPFVEADESLQDQIDHTPEGATLEVGAMSFEGNLVIRKAIHLKGAGPDQTFINGDGTGNVITIEAPGVHLENMSVRNSSFNRNSSEEYAAIKIRSNQNIVEDIRITDSYHGVYLSQAHDNVVRRVTVTGRGSGEIAGQGNGIMVYYSNKNQIQENQISDTRDGIFFDYSNENEVTGNDITQTRYGLHYMYSDRNRLTKNKFHSNIGGAAIMHSRGTILEDNQFSLNQGSRAFGVLLQSCDDTQVTGNQFFQNGRGMVIDQSQRNHIEANMIFHNQIGIELWASSMEQVFARNRFVKNTSPVITIGGLSNNRWSENQKGNYWGQEFPLADLDQNGIGDSPLVYESTLNKLIEKNELVYLFLNSPAIDIYETLGKFLNQQEVMVNDANPLLDNSEKPSFSWLWGIAVLGMGGIWYHSKRRKKT